MSAYRLSGKQQSVLRSLLLGLAHVSVWVTRAVMTISAKVKKAKIARKHDAIIAKFRADCISLGIEVD